MSADSRDARPTVVVDAENVRRSVWPNFGRQELIRLVEAWAAREGLEPLVVWEGAESADDLIARWVEEATGPYWLVTSDAALRRRAGGRAERVLGGGTFARLIRPE